MPYSALLLTLAAALLHASWNVLLAGSKQTQAAAVVMVGTSVVVFAPVAAFTWDVRWEALPFVLVSSVLQIVYFVLLVSAYRWSDLSLVYPVARGAAPVLVLAISAAVLAAGPTLGEGVGVALVACGVLLVRGGGATDRRGIVTALAIALCIATYTLLDKEGLEHADPVAYLELVMLGPAFVLPMFVARRGRVAALRSELRPAVVLAGVAGFGAYALVLAALERASAASVAAVRETSVLMATAMAAIWLGERVSRWRAIGAAAIVAGVALISLA